MADPQTVGESHDGDRAGAGDHDCAYVFGNPRACLTTMAQARLLLMRGRVLDHRHGEPGGPAEGDDDWVTPTGTGLYVPARWEPGDA